MTELTDIPDFVKLASAYGIDSAIATSNEQAEQIAKEMLKSDNPFVLVCDVSPKTTSK